MPEHLRSERPGFGSATYDNPRESFAELRDDIDELDPVLNHIWRWEWYPADEDNDQETFTVYLVLPRKDTLISFSCPITAEQEPEVLEWLRGPRVLGALRAMWAPLLTEEDTRG